MATAEKVVTGKVRFSYANVFVPQSMDPDKPPKYSVSVLIDKNDKDTIAKINAAIDKVKNNPEAQAKWGGSLPKVLKGGLRDGDAEKSDDAYVGKFFINASSAQKPGLVDADRNPIISADEFYSGCYGRASLSFFAYNAAGSKGIGCGLNNLQKLEEGERLGGSSSADADFA